MNYKNKNSNNNINIQDNESELNNDLEKNKFKDFVNEKTSLIYFEQNNEIVNFSDFENIKKISKFFDNNNNEDKQINVENDYIQNFGDKEDLFNAHRILDNYNNFLNSKELVDDDKLSNIDNSDLDYKKFIKEEKIVPDETLDTKPEIILSKSMINNKDEKEINKIKNDLCNFFGEYYSSILIIFNNYCDKKRFAIDLEGIRQKIKKNGMSNEQIDVIIKKSPEFICLCINNKMN